MTRSRGQGQQHNETAGEQWEHWHCKMLKTTEPERLYKAMWKTVGTDER